MSQLGSCPAPGPFGTGPVVTARGGHPVSTALVGDEAWELARLEALHRFGVLDTAPERAFDDLCALAAQLCGTPMALVSLVDQDRQWFKARVGVAATQTPREDSFCAHALGGGGPLVVPDTVLDARFAGNPLVTGEPYLRFYAGAPLVTEGNLVLGTLCVLDTEPRTLTPGQLEQLAALARQVVNQLELRRQADALAGEVAARVVAQAELAASRRLMDEVLAHTDVAVYAKDLDGLYLLANAATHEVLNRDDGQVLGRCDHDLFPALAADELRRNDLHVAATGARQTFTEQVLHPDGTLHDYLSTKFGLRDQAGRVYAVGGVSSDVTELSAARRAHAEAEQRWKALVEHSPVAVAVIGAEGGFVYANPQAESLYGADTTRALIGRRAAELVPAGAQGSTATLFASLLQGGPPLLAHRWTLLRLDGRELVVDVNAAAVTYAGHRAVQVELRDATAAVAAQIALRTSEARFRALFEHSPVGVAEALPDGTLAAVNPQLSNLLGYTTDEVIGKPISFLLADPTDAATQRQDMGGLHGGAPYFTERRYRRKDGGTLSVLVGVVAVRDDSGAVIRIIGSVLDITERVAALAGAAAAQAELQARTAFTDAVLDSIDVGVVACDAQGRLTLFNDATKTWHGIDLEAAPENTADPSRFADTFALHDADGVLLTPDQIPLLRALTEGSVRDLEMIISPRDLPSTRVLCNGRAMIAPNGRALGAVVAMTDITITRAQTLALQASETRFRTTFDNDPAGLAVLTPTGRAVQVNPALARLLGRTAHDLFALPDLLTLLGPGDRPELARRSDDALLEPAASATVERELRRPDGAQLWVLVTITELPDPMEGTCLLLQLEDITGRKTAEQRLTRSALHDSLTDLPNRAMLLDRTSRALARLARRPNDGLMALLFCDLDGFKTVNDTHGHAAGDELLVEVARRLSQVMRPTDTVARLGGDEFVVLCENLPTTAEATRIAVRVEEAISRPVPWRGQALTVTASVGIAYGSATVAAQELVRNADAAMYQAKTLGKNRHEVFDEDLRARSTSRVRIENDLRTALRTGNVEVHYQPIVELPSRRVTGVEALARIRLPDGTLAMPAEFIPVAEDTGLIVELGAHVLRTACQQLRAWREHAPDLQLAVNLSARQAARADLCDVVQAALADAGLPAHALALELTESVLLESARSTLSKLGELRASGVQIGIDDFGTGYASLRYLRDLPVTFLKVDRSFVAGMTHNHHDAVIVHTVTRLARDLGLGCVVEGVETQDQLELILDTGAHAQGYLFGRPVPATGFSQQM
ncbi:MAG: EAL domain-containing protein [Actinomycetota bacterium]